jgi:hypothetical protein
MIAKWTVLSASLLLACGESEEKTGEPNDSGVCSSMANSAPVVQEINVAQAQPTDAAGGDFVPGKYHLTTRSLYTGPDGPAGPNGNTRQETIVVATRATPSYDFDTIVSENGEADERVSFVIVPADTSIRVEIACPSNPAFGDFFFTATPTSFSVYDPYDNEVDLYVLQP